jgi:molybdenum-dependent DNA-binding transcriptional regulator ModE
VAAVELAQAQPDLLRRMNSDVPAGIELRHLRYFVALADAGSFTHAAKRMFIAQPTLSQQIRRLEEIVGTPLLQRRREGLRLTKAGTVLLDASRNVLSLVDHEVSHTRQAAGLDRQRLEARQARPTATRTRAARPRSRRPAATTQAITTATRPQPLAVTTPRASLPCTRLRGMLPRQRRALRVMRYYPAFHS